MNIKLVLDGLNCANCANKIESKVNKISGVKEATVNFSTSVLTVEIHEEKLKDEIVKEIKSIVKKLEPHVSVQEKIYGKKININQEVCKSSCCSTSHSSHNENSHSHEHGHSHEIKENNEGIVGYVKDNLMLIVGTIIYIIALIYKGNENLLSVLLFVASYLVIGWEVIWTAIKKIS